MDYKGACVVVLGASGFIGRWVARALTLQKCNLVLIVRDRKSAEEIFEEYEVHGRILESDLCKEDLALFFRQLRPSILFNLAGYGVDRDENDESLSFRINADLVARVCEAIARIRNRHWTGQDIVHVGSALEYGKVSGPLSEETVPAPTSLYGKSKLAATNHLAQCCADSAIKGLTARLFTVYGPGEHKSRLLPSLVTAAQRKEPLPLTAGEQRRDFTYVADVAEGLLRLGLLDARPGEVIHLATGKLSTVRHFAEVAARILRIPDEHMQFGQLPYRPEEMNHDLVSVTRLYQHTGWMPTTDIHSGIMQTVEWQQLHHL